MSRRHTGRKLAMKSLYQADITQKNIGDILDEFLEGSTYVTDTKEWATTLATGTFKALHDIDPLIKKYSIGWEFDRINPIDKSILRIAFFELTIQKTHPNIVLNEAIEIAKKYATDDSPKFINGILGTYVKDHPYTEG
jgi:N utilization substance protein B